MDQPLFTDVYKFITSFNKRLYIKTGESNDITIHIYSANNSYLKDLVKTFLFRDLKIKKLNYGFTVEYVTELPKNKAVKYTRDYNYIYFDTFSEFLQSAPQYINYNNAHFSIKSNMRIGNLGRMTFIVYGPFDNIPDNKGNPDDIFIFGADEKTYSSYTNFSGPNIFISKKDYSFIYNKVRKFIIEGNNSKISFVIGNNISYIKELLRQLSQLSELSIKTNILNRISEESFNIGLRSCGSETEYGYILRTDINTGITFIEDNPKTVFERFKQDLQSMFSDIVSNKLLDKRYILKNISLLEHGNILEEEINAFSIYCRKAFENYITEEENRLYFKLKRKMFDEKICIKSILNYSVVSFKSDLETKIKLIKSKERFNLLYLEDFRKIYNTTYSEK